MTPPILAVSDSPLARSLLCEHKLSVPVETGGPLTTSAIEEFPEHPWLLHNSVWNWSLAHPRALEQQDVLAVTRRAVMETRAPWLSVHLGFSAEHVAFRDGMQPVSEILGREQLIPKLTTTIDALKAAVEVPLLLENLDYNATGAYEHICEPEVISSVLRDTDTWFLLDLAHAQVSASRLGYTVDDYLAQLPLERVRQLHLSGPRPVGERLKDVHETMRLTDYELLAGVLEKTKPWAVTLEYRRDADLLASQLERLQTLLG